MRIAFVHNLQRRPVEEEAEFDTRETVELITHGLRSLGYDVRPVEASGSASRLTSRLEALRPGMVFNTAEGRRGRYREAFYPGLFEQLAIPYTGSDAYVCALTLDKQLSKIMVARSGLATPRWVFLEKDQPLAEPELTFPIIIKPNFEGSSKGITQESIVETPAELRQRAEALLARYPAGLIAEEYIVGRDVVVPFLEGASPRTGGVLEPSEYEYIDPARKWAIYDYDLKTEGFDGLRVRTPANLTPELRDRVVATARRAFVALTIRDVGRIDFRLTDSGELYFLEVNALPSLERGASIYRAGRLIGLDTEAQVLERILLSSARRYGVQLKATKKTAGPRVVAPAVTTGRDGTARPAARQRVRDFGLKLGVCKPGRYNAITDVPGVLVGHSTVIHGRGRRRVGEGPARTGVTAIIPRGNVFEERVAGGGFVLNGAGEVSGVTQVLEWGLIETPILLTNTLSVGTCSEACVRYMVEQYPEIGGEADVVIPIVGECDDSWLNDIAGHHVTADHVRAALDTAADGPVAEGNVGGGTGMITCDFKGGIGTASRRLSEEDGGYTVGVLVMSNFGNREDLRIDGVPVGRELAPLYGEDSGRRESYGSIIAVVATNAPLQPLQINRLAKRAALGIGRAGSHAAHGSGEIIIGFSTANLAPRETKRMVYRMNVLLDARISPLYRAVVEATEEAILNALFMAEDMEGIDGHFAPALPVDTVREILQRRGVIDKRGKGRPGHE